MQDAVSAFAFARSFQGHQLRVTHNVPWAPFPGANRSRRVGISLRGLLAYRSRKDRVQNSAKRTVRYAVNPQRSLTLRKCAFRTRPLGRRSYASMITLSARVSVACEKVS